MSENLKVGAGVGGAAGLAAGVVAGAKSSKKILTPLKNAAGKLMTKDEYVNSRIAANMDNLQSTLKGNRLAKAFTRVAKKATEDFGSIVKTANKSKIKWIVGLTAAGIAAGTAINAIVNKVSNKASDKASDKE